MCGQEKDYHLEMPAKIREASAQALGAEARLQTMQSAYLPIISIDCSFLP